MMLAYVIAAVAQVAPTPLSPRAVSQPVAQAPAPADWSTLPMLPYLRAPVVTPSMAAFVGGEVASDRCAVQRPANGKYDVRLDLAVLVDSVGTIRRVVPRAIGCPTVEQYGAGLVTGFARDNLPPRIGAVAGWYHTVLAFAWQG